jgi:hypothetical protein
VVAASPLVAGCGRDEGPTAAGEADLVATVQQSTLFEPQRALRLTLANGGDQDVEVSALRLASPGFEPLEPEDRSAAVQAGDRVVVPLPLGEALCGDEQDGGDEGPIELVADVDGEEVTVPLAERPHGMLADRRAEECEVAAVLADVDLRLGESWERTAPRTLAGEVELAQRRPGVTAAVEEVEGNVIFTVAADAPPSPWLEVSDDRPAASLPVTIDASRCDPHALIEYKRTYMLAAWVQVGDAEPLRVDVEATGAARRALEDLLSACLG